MSPPQSCLIANSNFSPPFPSSIAGRPLFIFCDIPNHTFSGQENIAPASCVLLSFADGSVVGYRLPLPLTPSGAWDKVQGSVLCLASEGNEIVAIGLSSGHVMIFDRQDMRAVFCSQTAQAMPGSALFTPSRIQLHICNSSSSNHRVIIVLARFTDGSLRVWKLLPCALAGVSFAQSDTGVLNCTEAPVMRSLQVVVVRLEIAAFCLSDMCWQYCEARGAGGGSKMFSVVNDRIIVSLDGDKLVRLWELFDGKGDDVCSSAQPKRILIGTDSLPVALFALQGGRFVGAVCVSGAVVVWVTDSGSIAFKGSITASLASSSSVEACVVECNGQVRIAASHMNIESGQHLMLYEVNFDGIRPELRCLCRYDASQIAEKLETLADCDYSTDTVGNGPDSLSCACLSSCGRMLLLGFKVKRNSTNTVYSCSHNLYFQSGLVLAWLLPRSRLYTLFKANGPIHSVVCWHLLVAPHISSPYERQFHMPHVRTAAFAVSFETTHGQAHTIAVR